MSFNFMSHLNSTSDNTQNVFRPHHNRSKLSLITSTEEKLIRQGMLPKDHNQIHNNFERLQFSYNPSRISLVNNHAYSGFTELIESEPRNPKKRIKRLPKTHLKLQSQDLPKMYVCTFILILPLPNTQLSDRISRPIP